MAEIPIKVAITNTLKLSITTLKGLWECVDTRIDSPSAKHFAKYHLDEAINHLASAIGALTHGEKPNADA